MPIQVPNFTTTASITGATLVSQADEQLNIFMDDVESYVESTYGTVAASLENEFSTQLALTTAKAQEAATSAASALASKNTAATSATNANTSATNSANSAGLATTKAQEASASAAVANADKVSAAASATDALASKNAAVTSETNALASKNAAAASAASALASKNAAATSAMDAASIYDMFDDRYLGSKVSDPLVDNDGGALQAGALYFNSTNNSVKVYTGTAWLALSSIDAYTKTEVNTSLALKVNNSEKGAANGVATLDGNGKVVLTQIPDSVLGQLEYMGTWNFTAMPTATQKGQYWIANTSGNGYVVGDWAVWNGSAFDKVDNTDAVATVAGRTGNVVLTKSDVGLANVDNTADSAKNVLSATKWTTARTIGMTGDVTWTSASFDGTGNVTGTSTLANSGVTAGTYGSASLIPTVTVDSKGRVTSIATNSVSIPSGAISVTGGDLTMSGNTGTAITNATLSNVGTAGTYRSVTTDSKGRITSGTNPTTLSGYGITDAVSKVTSTDNAIVRFNGTTGEVQNSGVIIDDAGNVGVGVTPSAWQTGWRAFELNNLGIMSRNAGSGDTTYYVNNGYWDGTNWKYKITSPATNYFTGAGTHTWSTAPSGTAGQPITWTNAMTLDASGVLNINSSASNGRINIGASSNYIYGDTSGNFIVGTGGADRVNVTANGILLGNFNTNQKCIDISHETGVIQSYNHNVTMNIPLKLNPASSGGNVLIGTETDNGVDKLQVNGSVKATGSNISVAAPTNVSGRVSVMADNNYWKYLRLESTGNITKWDIATKENDLAGALQFRPEGTTAAASLSTSGVLTASSFVGSLTGNASTATNISWTGITSKPTTLAGYGITDAATLNHEHDRTYISDTRGAIRLPSFYDDRFAQWDFQQSSDTEAGGDAWHGLLTVAKWAAYDPTHRQEQIAFTGDNLKRRTATSDTTWGTWKTMIDSSNYNSYSPTLTGIGASGTWGIGIAGNAATATSSQNEIFYTKPNTTWGGRVQLGGNGAGSGVATIASVQASDGNLHIDAGVGKQTYINYYNNGAIYLNGTTYSISANGSSYNGNAATATNVAWSGVTSKPTTLSGYGITDSTPSSHIGSTGTAHGNATTSVAGFMSGTDKSKLDGIAASANNYSLPVASSTVLGGVKAGTNVSIDANGVISANDSSVAWTEVTSKPTTLSGYGITDSIQSTLVSGTNIKTINGASVLGSGNLAISAGGLGIGQTWQNVTGSRVVGTTYTNSTGKPILINITCFNNSAVNTTHTLTVGGIIVGKIQNFSNSDDYGLLSAVVPLDTTYSLTVSTASYNMIWTELR